MSATGSNSIGAESVAGPNREGASGAGATPSRAIRILVADDSIDLASALERLLGTVAGFESLGHVGDADAMLSAARERPPTVIVCDLTMPGTSPLEAIALLKRERPALRVVAFSGFDDQESRSRALAAGADVFVSKGVEFDDLTNTIRAVAARV